MQPVALVPRGVDVSPALLALVSSAIQIQLIRDVGPAWGIQATCTAYPSLQDVPPHYAMVFLVSEAKGRAGLHFRPEHPDEPPFALVTFSPGGMWSVAASHEIIELLIDPTGNRLVGGSDPRNSSQSVSFLAEACDPCQDVMFAYQVDHEHPALVSDFCLPSFYGLGTQAAPYSFRRSILAPLSVANGGYLSWRDADGNWFQLRSLGGPTRVIGPLSENDILGSGERNNFRGALDRFEPGYAGPLASSRKSKRATQKYTAIRRASKAARSSRNKLLESYLDMLSV